MNDSSSTMSTSLASSSSAYTSDTKVIDFINDLKRAIQTGEFQQQLKSTSNDNNANEQEQHSLSVISNLINVDNLSNQTFSYIINWLKEQQPTQSQNDEAKKVITTGNRHSMFKCSHFLLLTLLSD